MSQDLRERAEAIRWYHTLKLPGVKTTGMFDMRPYVPEYGVPEDLSGQRVLEIGTFDGFWAFELERRGAEVFALDIDDLRDLDYPPRRRPEEFSDVPRGEGFRVARELLGSKVERITESIYRTFPEDVGTFDMVFCGSVLLHVRDQLLALERIANLVKPGGLFISAEEYEPITNLIPFPVARFRGNRESAVVFWLPSRKAWRQMLWYAGFDEVSEHGRFTMKAEKGWGVRHVVLHARK